MLFPEGFTHHIHSRYCLIINQNQLAFYSRGTVMKNKEIQNGGREQQHWPTAGVDLGYEQSNPLKSRDKKQWESAYSQKQRQKMLNLCSKYFILALVVLILGAIILIFILNNQYWKLLQKGQLIQQVQRRQYREIVDYRDQFQHLLYDIFPGPQFHQYAQFNVTPQYEIYRANPIPQPELQHINLISQSKLQELSNKFATNFDFYRQLFVNWEEGDQLIDQLYYYRLNSTYNLDEPVPERRICVMSPFKNLLNYGTANASFHLFLKSINAQNYSNYHVYMMDDASTDNSSAAIIQELPKYPRLSNRLTLLQNKFPIGALGNRDSVTRKFCGPGDIVMDIDGDDALIGKQAFNFFNRYYHNSNAWFVYSNFIQIEGDKQGDGRKIAVNMSSALAGPSKQIPKKIHELNTYRTNQFEWCTSELRSYLYELYVKIPINYLIDKDTGQYQIKASDRYVMYALAELAGPKHTKFLDEYPYFYFQPNYRALERFECSFAVIQFYEAKARIEVPFQPLESLESQARAVQNYKIPMITVNFFIQMQYKLLNCIKKVTKFKLKH